MRSAFDVADSYVTEVAEMMPPLATMLGVPGHDHEWGEYLSRDGAFALDRLNRRYRGELQQ
jgi:hypothetical protein